MATIYTARNIVGNDKTIPLFNLKGLVNQAPSTLSNLNIQGIPLERQVAYTQYSANIASFIYATLTRTTITVSPAPLALIDLYSPLPLNPPMLSFTLTKALSSDQADKLIGNLGPGATRTQSGKTTIFHAPSLPTHQLKLVEAVSTQFFNAGRDAVNPKGMRSYQFLSTVILTFLHVHAYPAFRDEDPESITAFENLVGGDSDGDYFAKEYKVKDKDGKEVQMVRDLSERRRVDIGEKRSAEDVDMDEEPAKKFTKNASGYLRTRGHETVFKARPVKETQKNIGSVKDIPSSPGILFPYFTGLIQPDANFVSGMILRRFYQLLGNTHEKCQKNYLDIRHGVNSLASTPRGMEVTHILLGIDLALETQSRCFVIIDNGKYQGFSLLGARYAIFSNTKWFAPADEETLALALNRMDPHESAVDDIIQKLEKLKGLSQYTGMTNRTIFSEPKSLAEELSKLSISEIDDDDVRDLDRYVKSLNYMGSGYLSQNPQMIADMLATLSSAQDIELDRPTYFPSIKAPFENRNFKLLSRFGPEAPSFWNDRGSEILCKPVDKSVQSANGKRKMGEPDIFGNMPPKLLITPKPLLVAVRDLDRVVDTGKVKMDIKERAGRYRNISLENEETRKSVWKGLVELCAKETKKVKLTVEADIVEGGIAVDEALLKLLG